MTKLFYIVSILCFTVVGHSQDTNASKLVTLLHQQDMGFRLEMIQQFQPLETPSKVKDSAALAQTLYTKMEAVYQKQFSMNPRIIVL